MTDNAQWAPVPCSLLWTCLPFFHSLPWCTPLPPPPQLVYLFCYTYSELDYWLYSPAGLTLNQSADSVYTMGMKILSCSKWFTDYMIWVVSRSPFWTSLLTFPEPWAGLSDLILSVVCHPGIPVAVLLLTDSATHYCYGSGQEELQFN